MLTEVHYRTFDEVLNSVKDDFKGLTLEGFVDPQALVKVALKVNGELGIKISPQRTKLVHIKHGKGKLPADFSVLNYALLCEDKRTVAVSEAQQPGYGEGFLEGVVAAQNVLKHGSVGQFTRTIDLQPGTNTLEHPLHSSQLVVQATSMDGLQVQFQSFQPTLDQVVIYSEHEHVLPGVKIILMGAQGSEKPVTEVVVDTQQELVVRYTEGFKREEYRQVVPLRMKPNKGVSSECVQFFQHCANEAFLKDGFLVTGAREGVVVVNYQSLAEDDEGNLLTLDHFKVNEYYEYEFKKKILENMYLDGEPVQERLGYVKNELRPARTNALSFINTPDFNTMRRNWERNRQAMNHKYYSMFSS